MSTTPHQASSQGGPELPSTPPLSAASGPASHSYAAPPQGGPLPLAPQPYDFRIVQESALSPLSRQALKYAQEIVPHAFAPDTKFHVAAVVVLDEGARMVGATNCEASMRGKNCAERNALAHAMEDGFSSIDQIVVTARKNSESPDARAVCLCGSCRALLKWFAHPETLVVMSPTQPKDILVSTMRGIIPFGYLDEQGLPDARDVRSSQGARFQALGELTALERQIVERAALARERSYVPYTGVKTGAIVRAASGAVLSGSQFEGDLHTGGHSAEISAITKAVVSGSPRLDFMAMASSDPTGRTIFQAPDGHTRQVLLDFVHVAKQEIDLLILMPDERSVLRLGASTLLPLGKGMGQYPGIPLDPYRLPRE